MKKFEVVIQEIHTYTIPIKATTEEEARTEALRVQKEGLDAHPESITPLNPETWGVSEPTHLDKDLYGTRLRELLDNPAMSPMETLKICIKLEASAERVNTLYSLDQLAEHAYLEEMEGLKMIMQKAGMDTSVLTFDSDPRGIAIKVNKEDWPYKDVMSGIPVLIHESLH